MILRSSLSNLTSRPSTATQQGYIRVHLQDLRISYQYLIASRNAQRHITFVAELISDSITAVNARDS